MFGEVKLFLGCLLIAFSSSLQASVGYQLGAEENSTSLSTSLPLVRFKNIAVESIHRMDSTYPILRIGEEGEYASGISIRLKKSESENSLEFRFIAGLNYFQTECEATYFYKFSGLVLAYHLAAGYSEGEVSRMHQFTLGGSKHLRGYLEKEFRGKNYYLQQMEIRFPFYKNISGAFFTDIGSTDISIKAPKVTHGFGLRIAVPSSLVSQLRMEFAANKESSSFNIDVGHVF